MVKTFLAAVFVIGFIVVASFFDFESPVTDLEPPLGESTAVSPLPLISSYKSEKSLCGTGMNVVGPSGASDDGQPAIKMRCAPGEVIVSGAIIGSCCSTACDPGATSCGCKACSDIVEDHATIANLADTSYDSNGHEKEATSDDGASIFSWSASMRCTTSQAFKDRIHYINCTSIAEQAQADPDDQRACDAEAAAAARAAAAPACGWRCGLLFWYPVGALAVGWLLLLVALALDINNLRGDDELLPVRAPYSTYAIFVCRICMQISYIYMEQALVLSAMWTFMCIWPLIWSSPFGAGWVSLFVGAPH
eukprot:COSAG03_NODE_2005_length_3231_cov_163.575990_3_plen_307_part_00